MQLVADFSITVRCQKDIFLKRNWLQRGTSTFFRDKDGLSQKGWNSVFASQSWFGVTSLDQTLVWYENNPLFISQSVSSRGANKCVSGCFGRLIVKIRKRNPFRHVSRRQASSLPCTLWNHVGFSSMNRKVFSQSCARRFFFYSIVGLESLYAMDLFVTRRGVLQTCEVYPF